MVVNLRTRVRSFLGQVLTGAINHAVSEGLTTIHRRHIENVVVNDVTHVPLCILIEDTPSGQ